MDIPDLLGPGIPTILLQTSFSFLKTLLAMLPGAPGIVGLHVSPPSLQSSRSLFSCLFYNPKSTQYPGRREKEERKPLGQR